MNISWQQVLPVIVSILIIITVAVLRAYSKTLAAILATMPLNIPIALWIMYGGDSEEMLHFTQMLLVGLGATGLFTLAVWLAARAGLGLVPMLLAGYGAWAAALIVQHLVRAYVL